MGQLQELIPAALDGERVDRAVSMAAGVSRKRAAQLIEAGSVAVNGAAINSKSTRLRVGDRLSIEVDESQAVGPQPDPSVELAVVFEDDYQAHELPAEIPLAPFGDVNGKWSPNALIGTFNIAPIQQGRLPAARPSTTMSRSITRAMISRQPGARRFGPVPRSSTPI